jgi:hypothetical protein
LIVYPWRWGREKLYHVVTDPPTKRDLKQKLQEEVPKLNAWSFCVFIGNG